MSHSRRKGQARRYPGAAGAGRFQHRGTKVRAFLKTHRSILLTVAIALDTSPAGSNVYLDNPPHVVDRLSETYLAPVGELEANSSVIEDGKSVRHVGSGVLISPCYILTSAHVPLGSDPVARPGKSYHMTFRAGVGKTAPFLGSTMAKLVLASKREIDGGNDWALMRLNSCVGTRQDFGWFDVTTKWNRLLVNEQILAVGYAGSSSRGVMMGSVGKVMSHNANSGNLRVSASFTNGQSGGAVLVLEDGQVKLAGMPTFQNRDSTNINKGEFDTYSDLRSNEFINAAAIVNRREVRALLQADLARWGIANPNAERAKAAMLR